MGLIKAIAGSIGGTLRDQWLDLIKCDNMDMETLMVKQTTKSGQISKSSRIIVAPGQVAVIYDSGSVLDATAEEGIYNFDQSSSPSFFAGEFGPVFKEMWQRFTYGGTPAKEQAVFFFNAKEILDNKFGTATPIMFQDWSHPIPNQMTGSLAPMGVNIRCYGKYTFRLDDMGVFMRIHAGTANVIKKHDIIEQMRTEVMASLQNVLNEMGNSAHRVPVLELPSYTDEIKKVMDENVYDEPIRKRGIRLVGFAIESVSLDDKSQEKIDRYEYSSNSMMQQGKIIDVMETAAGNAAGAAGGFMGVGMMNMGSGGMSGSVMQNAFNQQGGQVNYDPYNQGGQAQAKGVPCPKCGTMITGKFCPECGTPAPAPKAAKKCPKCGTESTGKFCPECGTPMPADEGPKKCPKCGAEVTGKFCPECGTPVA
ncbi:MAG: SPFH domain-containing protein [Bacteroidales bacterium]|nr:SPFH domain-containing protein [Bacteroidales bacterium]